MYTPQLILRTLFIIFCYMPYLAFAQNESKPNEQISSYLKKINWEYLFPNSDLTIGLFDAKIIDPALFSIKPLNLKEQKYSKIEIGSKNIFDDSVLVRIAKERKFSLDSIKKSIQSDANFYTRKFGNTVFDEIEYQINDLGDTTLRALIDKPNQKIIRVNNKDTYMHLYDEQNRLIKKTNKVLMERSWTDKTPKQELFYDFEEYYYSYSKNSIQAVKHKKDTLLIGSFSKKEYKKISKEIENVKKYSNFYFVKNGNKYDKYYESERFDTMIISLDTLYRPIERIKYLNGLNRKIEITKYFYNEKKQVILEDKKTYGSNEIDGTYIDSSKVIFIYNDNDFLTERKYLWYQHFDNGVVEQSELYNYKMKIENDILYIKKSFQQKDEKGIVEDESTTYIEYWVNQNGEVVEAKTCFSKGCFFDAKIIYHLK